MKESEKSRGKHSKNNSSVKQTTLYRLEPWVQETLDLIAGGDILGGLSLYRESQSKEGDDRPSLPRSNPDKALANSFSRDLLEGDFPAASSDTTSPSTQDIPVENRDLESPIKRALSYFLHALIYSEHLPQFIAVSQLLLATLSRANDETEDRPYTQAITIINNLVELNRVASEQLLSLNSPALAEIDPAPQPSPPLAAHDTISDGLTEDDLSAPSITPLNASTTSNKNDSQPRRDASPQSHLSSSNALLPNLNNPWHLRIADLCAHYRPFFENILRERLCLIDLSTLSDRPNELTDSTLAIATDQRSSSPTTEAGLKAKKIQPSLEKTLRVPLFQCIPQQDLKITLPPLTGFSSGYALFIDASQIPHIESIYSEIKASHEPCCVWIFDSIATLFSALIVDELGEAFVSERSSHAFLVAGAPLEYLPVKKSLAHVHSWVDIKLPTSLSNFDRMHVELNGPDPIDSNITTPLSHIPLSHIPSNEVSSNSLASNLISSNSFFLDQASGDQASGDQASGDQASGDQTSGDQTSRDLPSKKALSKEAPSQQASLEYELKSAMIDSITAWSKQNRKEQSWNGQSWNGQESKGAQWLAASENFTRASKLQQLSLLGIETSASSYTHLKEHLNSIDPLPCNPATLHSPMISPGDKIGPPPRRAATASPDAEATDAEAAKAEAARVSLATAQNHPYAHLCDRIAWSAQGKRLQTPKRTSPQKNLQRLVHITPGLIDSPYHIPSLSIRMLTQYYDSNRFDLAILSSESMQTFKSYLPKTSADYALFNADNYSWQPWISEEELKEYAALLSSSEHDHPELEESTYLLELMQQQNQPTLPRAIKKRLKPSFDSQRWAVRTLKGFSKKEVAYALFGGGTPLQKAEKILKTLEKISPDIILFHSIDPINQLVAQNYPHCPRLVMEHALTYDHFSRKIGSDEIDSRLAQTGQLSSLHARGSSRDTSLFDGCILPFDSIPKTSAETPIASSTTTQTRQIPSSHDAVIGESLDACPLPTQEHPLATFKYHTLPPPGFEMRYQWSEKMPLKSDWEIPEDALVATTHSLCLDNPEHDPFFRCVNTLLEEMPHIYYAPLGAIESPAHFKERFTPEVRARIYLLGESNVPSDIFRGVDLYLDTFSHSSAMGVINAIASGLPMLTLSGPARPLASRYGAGLLGDEHTCASMEEYMRKARELLTSDRARFEAAQLSYQAYEPISTHELYVGAFEEIVDGYLTQTMT